MYCLRNSRKGLGAGVVVGAGSLINAVHHGREALNFGFSLVALIYSRKAFGVGFGDGVGIMKGKAPGEPMYGFMNVAQGAAAGEPGLLAAIYGII